MVYRGTSSCHTEAEPEPALDYNKVVWMCVCVMKRLIYWFIIIYLPVHVSCINRVSNCLGILSSFVRFESISEIQKVWRNFFQQSVKFFCHILVKYYYSVLQLVSQQSKTTTEQTTVVIVAFSVTMRLQVGFPPFLSIVSRLNQVNDLLI